MDAAGQANSLGSGFEHIFRKGSDHAVQEIVDDYGFAGRGESLSIGSVDGSEFKEIAGAAALNRAENQDIRADLRRRRTEGFAGYQSTGGKLQLRKVIIKLFVISDGELFFGAVA